MGGKQSSSTFDAKLKAKEWQWQLKTEVKHLDREIKKIQAGEAKLQKEIHAQAAKGNVQSVQMLAKSIVKSRKAVQRLEKTKASMHSVDLQLTTHLATISTVASLRLSADVMKHMNEIARVPEVSSLMAQMRAEMAKVADAEDGIEEALAEDGEVEEAAVEVQRVLEEMALEKMGPLAQAATASAASAPVAPVAPEAVPLGRQLVTADGVAEPAPPQRPAPAPQLTRSPTAPSAAPMQATLPAAAVTPPPAQEWVSPSADQALARVDALLGGGSAPVAQAPFADTPAGGPAPGGGCGGGGDDDDLMARLARLKGGS